MPLFIFPLYSLTQSLRRQTCWKPNGEKDIAITRIDHFESKQYILIYIVSLAGYRLHFNTLPSALNLYCKAQKRMPLNMLYCFAPELYLLI